MSLTAPSLQRSFPHRTLPRLLALLACLAALLAQPVAAKDREQVVWEGADQFVKLVPQDKLPDGSQPPPNSHPANLQSKDIQIALGTLAIWREGGLFSEEKNASLFTVGETQLLGRRLAEALARAEPNQDVTFAVVSAYDKALVGKSQLSVAGRVFYLDGKLHLLLGDVLRETRSQTAAIEGSFGDTDATVDRRMYPHEPGRRAKERKLDAGVVAAAGVAFYADASKVERNDWLVLDLPKIVAEAERKAEPKGGSGVEAKRLEAEAAKLNMERRQMREEMARMRKEMRELGAGGAGAAGAAAGSLEERLATLDALREKSLISEEEYARKRKEILDNI